MLALLDTNDRLRITTTSAADLDVVAHMVNYSSANALTGFLKQLTTINSATTTTICSEPTGTGGDDRRNIKQITIRNRHASLANDVTVIYQDNATNYEICKFTLRAGDTLQYQEGVGWYLLTNEFKLDVKLVVSADVANATTSFADVTGLTYPIEAGKKYGFECYLFHIENASTTGARFACNGPAATLFRAYGVSVFAGSLTAATFNAALADVTAYDTSVVGVTTSSAGTPQVAGAWIAGYVNPSASGTFAIRSQSEVAVAAGVTVKAGSWMRLFEVDN